MANQYEYFDRSLNVTVVGERIDRASPSYNLHWYDSLPHAAATSIIEFYRDFKYKTYTKGKALDYSLDWKHYYHLFMMELESI